MAWARLRLLITSVQGGGNYVTIGELQFRGTIGGATLCTGGTAFADSYYTSGTYGPLTADKAFDGTNAIANSWISNETSLPHHVGYVFAAPVDIAEIAISWPPGYGANNEQPKGVSLQGSNDGGSTWTTIQSWTLATFTSGETKTLTVIPDITAAAAGTPRRPSGAVAARHAPPGFAAAAGMPRRPSGAVAVTHTFAPPPHVLATRYSLTLTGAADGLPDAALPLANWQAVARLVGSTYLTCTVPFSPAVEAAILARPHGTLIVRQHLIYASETITAEIVAAPWDAAPRIDEGGRSASVTLAGLAPQPARAPKSVTLRGVSYRRLDGGVTVRSAIDLFAAPGDTLDYGDGDLVADQITYICTPGAEWMEARSDG